MQVEEDVKGAKKGKKLFSFWIVWPQIEDEKKAHKVDHDSDDEEAKDDVPKEKDLKQVDVFDMVCTFLFIIKL